MAEQNKNNNQQVDVNQLLKVRREKLADLQAQGKDPFQITKYDVTNHTTEIKDNFEQFECQHDEEGKLILIRMILTLLKYILCCRRQPTLSTILWVKSIILQCRIKRNIQVIQHEMN